jgi:hypothetical protein
VFHAAAVAYGCAAEFHHKSHIGFSDVQRAIKDFAKNPEKDPVFKYGD